MKYYLKAVELLLNNEGYYSNDKDDVGGETYRGISRRYYSSWFGWNIIDISRKESDFPECLRVNNSLEAAVKKFYKDNYWNRFLGDVVADLDYNIAEELLDACVNMGKHRGVKFLQKGLNLLNKSDKLWKNIVEDGNIGNITIKALTSCIQHKRNKTLYKIMNVLQGEHYLDYMTKSESQEKFAMGWFTRVTFSK